jgi:hypothetical protein
MGGYRTHNNGFPFLAIMSYHTTKLFQKDIDVLGKMCVAKLSEYELEMLEQDWKNGASCDRLISCFVQGQQ